MIDNYETVDVFIDVDVAKGEHHAVALSRAGKVLLDKALPNEEAKLRALIGKLKYHSQILFVVDQPVTIGSPIRERARGLSARLGDATNR